MFALCCSSSFISGSVKAYNWSEINESSDFTMKKPWHLHSYSTCLIWWTSSDERSDKAWIQKISNWCFVFVFIILCYPFKAQAYLFRLQKIRELKLITKQERKSFSWYLPNFNWEQHMRLESWLLFVSLLPFLYCWCYPFLPEKQINCCN